MFLASLHRLSSTANRLPFLRCLPRNFSSLRIVRELLLAKNQVLDFGPAAVEPDGAIGLLPSGQVAEMEKCDFTGGKAIARNRAEAAALIGKARQRNGTSKTRVGVLNQQDVADGRHEGIAIRVIGGDWRKGQVARIHGARIRPLDCLVCSGC